MRDGIATKYTIIFSVKSMDTVMTWKSMCQAAVLCETDFQSHLLWNINYL